MPTPYRITDLDQFNNVPTGGELAEISQGGSHSFQIPLASFAWGKTQTIIASGGTTTILQNNYTDFLINTTGAVILNLPDSTQRSGVPISVADIAGTPNVTINRAGSQLIMGLTSINLAAAYGGITLWPINAGSGGWFVK